MSEEVRYCKDCEKFAVCEARFIRAVLEMRDMMREIRDSFTERVGASSAVPVGALEVCIGKTACFEDDDGREHR